MQSIIKDKSYQFALQIIQLSLKIKNTKKEFILTQQLLKSGTSIGANVEEALGGQSSRDFFAKMSIAYKEARETDYWLRLLNDAKFINGDDFVNAIAPLQEILKILAKIQISSKMKQKTT